MDNSISKTLPSKRERNEESCGDEEREHPVVIPSIVRIVPIRVEPPTVVIAVRVEDVRVAVRNVWCAIHVTTRRILFGLYNIRDF